MIGRKTIIFEEKKSSSKYLDTCTICDLECHFPSSSLRSPPLRAIIPDGGFKCLFRLIFGSTHFPFFTYKPNRNCLCIMYSIIKATVKTNDSLHESQNMSHLLQVANCYFPNYLQNSRNNSTLFAHTQCAHMYKIV